ncbi:MAG: HAMP domain-containing sensor histidine kinase, partial [Pseudomonadota bacterium]
MDVETITDKLVNALKENNILFSLYGKNVAEMTLANKISENNKTNPLDDYVGKLNGINLGNQKSGIISKAGLFDKESKYVYYELSANYPYIIMICYDRAVSLHAFEKLLIPRLIQILLICIFMLFLLWIVRLRIITPVVELSKITDDLICGKPYSANIAGGASEVYMLAGKIKILNDYISEIRLVEEENNNKNLMLNQALEISNLSNKVKLEFLTSMSHELRVSLNTILGFAEIIKSQENLSAENIKQYIDDIYYAAGNLSALTDDVLALSDAENNMAEMQEKPVEIRHSIASSLRAIAERFAANKLTAELKISGGLPNLLIDQVCFEKIIFNLLDNIALHSKQEDQIIITAYIEKDGKNKNFLSIAMVNSILKSKVGKSGGYVSNLTNLGLPLTKALIAMN